MGSGLGGGVPWQLEIAAWLVLARLPGGAVDFLWSEAVLEHVRRDRFLDTLGELHRIQKPDGLASHRVDLRDHLNGALDNLRFPDWFWENETVAGSGFYTNRIGFGGLVEAFRAAGFGVEALGCRRWDTLPKPRAGCDPSTCCCAAGHAEAPCCALASWRRRRSAVRYAV